MQRSAGVPRRPGVSPGFLFLAALVLATACGDETGVTSPRPTMLGVVQNASTNTPVVGAQVTVGSSVDTTDQMGRYAFTHLEPGATKLKVNATGFDSVSVDVTVTTGEVVQNVQLTRKELFDLGDFSVYIPESVDDVSAVLVALGGPDTRGFSSATSFGAPMPEVEASLQAFGQQLRTMARFQNLAVIGTSKTAIDNSAAGDKIILDALAAAAKQSGRPEIANAPVLMYGLSSGGPEASGFATRHPARLAGLFLKAPLSVELLTTEAARSIPTFVVLAELDAFVDNSAIKAAFQANRKAGALWALAMEAGVPHQFFTSAQQELTSNWMYTTLNARALNDEWGITAYPETSGWLGDHATGEIAAWKDYPGDRNTASWFPSGAVAENWRAFRKPGE
jgi:Dienelactone hydrolase and related enzymes